MPKTNKFGSAHTEEKLQKLEAYLKVFSTALKNRDFRLIYFDAFAGTGDVQIGPDDATMLDGIDEYSPFIKGSAQRALQFGKAFAEYIFVDTSKKNIGSLLELKKQHPDIADRISIRHGEANDEIRNFCKQMDWKKSRAVVFLDPYGNQVKWKTVEAIAQTEAIDLWYLFPAGLGVYRQISKDSGVHETHVASVDDLFGTKAWREVFIEERPMEGLFDTYKSQKKRATVDSVTRFMVDRMKGIFKGGVLDEWLPLGSRKIHMYSLVFAWANPSPKAKLAGKLAQAVLRSEKSGRTK